MDDIISDNGCVYVEINNGVYGLKYATIVAYNKLVKHMDVHGYYPIPCTTGFLAHLTLSTNFFELMN